MIFADARWFPVIVVSFRGPYTRPIIDAYFEQQMTLARRALRENVFLVTIAKSPDAPDAQARRWIAEATKAMPAELRARTVRSVCIVDGALQRGVVTALSWLFKDMADLEAVTSEEAAVLAVRDLLTTRVEPIPPGLDASVLRRVLRASQTVGVSPPER